MNKTQFIIIFVLGILLAGCSPDLSEVDFGGAASPCEYTDRDVGQRVIVGGLLEFVDATAPDGWYADLERENCRIGLWVISSDYQLWQPSNPEVFKEGAVVVAEGFLTSQPLPDRPDEFQLIIELDQEPQSLLILDLGERTSSHNLPACDYKDIKTGEEIQTDGVVLLVDDSAAAGVYLELDSGGCYRSIWVESRFYDEWSGPEKDSMTVGSDIMIKGIYTIVRGEPTIDITIPPARK
jgi:hypothetical protein